MKILTPLIFAVAAAATCYCADITYSESNKPADTTAITVSGGTATMAGVQAFRNNLRRHWAFDAVGDGFLRDSLAGAMLSCTRTLDFVPTGKFGVGCVSTAYINNEGKSAAASLKAVEIPDFVKADGSSPFTVSFWFNTTNISNNATRRLFYFGPGHGGKTLGADQFLDFMYGSVPDGGTVPTGWRCFNSKMMEAFVVAPDNRWVHVAIVSKPAETSGEITVSVYIDGVRRRSHTKAFNVEDDTPVMLLGGGYSTSSASSIPAAYHTMYDEFMLFDAALTDADVACLYSGSRPYEFSAGWDIESDGILDIYGREPHQVRGTGKVTTEAGLTLSGGNGIFHGEISGAGLAVGKTAGATQILTGASTYTGATTVAVGKLKIDPALSVTNLPAFNGSVIAYYPFDDIENPGRDYSGNGNHLTSMTDGFVGGVEWREDATGPGAMGFDAAGPVNQCLSVSRLNGFGEGEDADTAFAVGAWVCVTNAVYREGFFAAAGGDFGIRFHEASPGTRWYYGDCNSYASGHVATPSSLYGTWMHVAVVYDFNAESGKQRLYLNGSQLYSTSTMRDNTICHAAGKFFVGRGYTTLAQNRFGGSIDEVFVIKLKSGSTLEEITADVAKMMNHRRTAAGSASYRVLPSSTVLTVSEGAAVEITNAVETVAGLSGAGSVVVDGGASFAVADGGRIFNADLIGGVTGDGAFGIGTGVVWSLSDVSAGEHSLFPVPAGFTIDSASSSTWKVAGAERRILSWRVSQGRIVVDIKPGGLMMLVF